VVLGKIFPYMPVPSSGTGYNFALHSCSLKCYWAQLCPAFLFPQVVLGTTLPCIPVPQLRPYVPFASFNRDLFFTYIKLRILIQALKKVIKRQKVLVSCSCNKSTKQYISDIISRIKN
jgi:hypothetical protein